MDLDAFIVNAIEEDVGDGDHTSAACIPFEAKGKAELLVKEAGTIAGVELAEKVFGKIDPDLELSVLIKDGSKVIPDDIIFKVQGNLRSILMAERLVLNLMQRMSGIATATSLLAKELEGLKTKILDTRKTTPGMRAIEKWAVRIGGGENHRLGLFDMILIKDNHIDYAGGIRNAILKANQYLQETGKDLKIEIEARNLEEVEEILETGKVDRIMLDNFSFENTRKAVELIDGKYETESSGNITIDTIRKYAACGVDFISVGAITHSVKSLDLSLKAVK